MTRYNPLCEQCNSRPKMDRCGVCEECWYEDNRAVFDPCPMGCGRTTEDVYGGPCKACWESVV